MNTGLEDILQAVCDALSDDMLRELLKCLKESDHDAETILSLITWAAQNESNYRHL